MTEWFRNKIWNSDIAEEFEARLKRSRGAFYKAQYLKIQAIELVQTENDHLLEIAEGLAKRVINDYPDEKSEKSSALHLLGDIYRRKNLLDQAIKYYKETLDFEAEYPKVQTNAYLDYAELIVKTKKSTCYSEVEKYLLDRIPNNLFPIAKYKGYSILAIINKHKGDTQQMDEYLTLANEFANARTSGLKYHQYLGLVISRDIWVDKLLGS